MEHERCSQGPALLIKWNLLLKTEDDNNLKISDITILKTWPQKGEYVNKHKYAMQFTANIWQWQLKCSFHVILILQHHIQFKFK
jgi:hypothetical protein